MNEQQQTLLLQMMAKQMGVDLPEGMNTKAAADVNTSTLLFGQGGIWSVPGMSPDVISAHVRPHGLGAVLSEMGHVFPSNIENPRLGILTGYTGTTGSEPTNPCDDAPAGFVKSGTLTFPFGRVARDTQTIEIDKVGLQLNGGVNTDLRLRGRLLGLTNMPPGGLNQDQALSIVTMSEMVTVGVNMERKLSVLNYQGNTANNTAGGGYKEYAGLDRIVATGQLDADTGVAMPAADSDVKDFGFDNIDGSDGRNIVQYLSMLEYYLNYNATTMGLDPVEWVITMPPGLWQVLSEVWPVQYSTNPLSATLGTGAQIFVDGGDTTAVRDRMRNERFIIINGNRYRVVADTGIAEETNITNANVGLGQYASSIYMLPLTIVGGFPVLYMEHVDYSAWRADTALLRGFEHFWTDGGLYSWAIDNNKWCYKLSAKTEPRLVLRTPHLAGRIDNVLYEPLQHLRDADPDSPYWQNGGVSLRSGESLSAVYLS